MYEVESLKNGIEQARKNIIVFEEAIDKENATIKEYRGYIQLIEDKESNDNKDRRTS